LTSWLAGAQRRAREWIGEGSPAAAIYTNGETALWAALRKISIRVHSWFNWFYPMPF
jgi:hypothetical protein